jgi:predicted secreted Zn-dependent protease
MMKIKRSSLLFSFSLLFLAGCILLPAGIPAQTGTLPVPTAGPVSIPNAELVYYEISGSTAGELRAQLDSLGPRGYDGYNGDATTNWTIHWNWPGYGTGQCDLSAAVVTDDIQVILPHWNPPAGASPELVAKWNEYIRRLVEHEKGHADFVVASLPAVAEAIHAATCDTAESAAQAALVPIRQQDVDYDAATQHGATQGARFP